MRGAPVAARTAKSAPIRSESKCHHCSFSNWIWKITLPAATVFLLNARPQTASDGLYGEKQIIALSSIDFDTARSATALYQGRVQKSLRCVSHCCVSARHCH